MSASARKSKSAKKLFKDLFALKSMERPLFIPLVYRYASRVSKMTVEEMLSKAGNLSRSLTMAQDLFEYDGIVSHYDNYLELELLSRSLGWVKQGIVAELLERQRVSPVTGSAPVSVSEVGQVPVVFEATGHLCDVAGKDVPIIGVVNSPLTIVSTVLGNGGESSFGARRDELREPLNDARAMTLDLIKAYCDLRVDAVWLIEEDWSGMSEDDLEWVKPLYRTFWNVTQYYDVRAIMGWHRYERTMLEKYFTLGADGVFFGGQEARDVSPEMVADLSAQYGCCAGLACPSPGDPGADERLDALIQTINDRGVGLFLSTPSEVALDTPVEWINGIVERVKG
jgi:hypothetical protein